MPAPSNRETLPSEFIENAPTAEGAVQEAAPNKWLTAYEASRRTARWARTMTKVAISQSSGKGSKAQPQWEVVNFLGRNKAESRGIVDLLVIRKNHEDPGGVLKRGDLFDMVIIQVKGGKAPRPTADDGIRLNAVKKAYGARAVLLSEWKAGSKAVFKELVGTEWVELADPKQVFSPTRKKVSTKTLGRTGAAKESTA